MIKNLISVIIPTFNGEEYIKDCLESIAKQDYPHEIIVIDDISTDDTISIVKEFDVKLIINKVHKGQVAAKNTGIKNMNGEYFFTIDQDDRLKSNVFGKLVNELNNNKKKIVMAMLEDFAEDEFNKKFCHSEPFRGILTGAALFRRDVFDVIGLFDESIMTGDVIDLINRCDKNGISIYKTNLITCERRIHNNNYGKTNNKDEYRDYAKLLRRRFIEGIGNAN